jgi:four helix bundle protein
MADSELRTFEDLRCRQACRRLRIFVSKEVATRFPPEERFLLRSQILDSSRSSTANIAEGYGRYYYLDDAKFCRNARGSAYETLDHLITANDEGSIDTAVINRGRELVRDAVQLVNGCIRYLKSFKEHANRVREGHSEYATDEGDAGSVDATEIWCAPESTNQRINEGVHESPSPELTNHRINESSNHPVGKTADGEHEERA